MRYITYGLAMVLFAFNLMAQPKIEMENGDEYHWGTVKPNDNPLKATVKIFNRGDQDLVIKGVHPSCGCTTAPLDKNIIPPGEYSNLEITFNFGNATGETSKSIIIRSNDPKRESINYYIKAKVDRPLVAFPQHIHFSELYFAREAVANSVIKNNTTSDIKITKVETIPEVLGINIKEGDYIPALSDFNLEIRFTPVFTGNQTAKVTLYTDHIDAPKFELMGYGIAIDGGDFLKDE